MDYAPHYAFALGYAAGFEGVEQKPPVALLPKLREFYDIGYEQGFADDLAGEVNAGVLAG